MAQPGTTSPVVRFRFRHQNGAWLYLEAVGRTILNERHEIRCVINSRDVTERVRAESQLRSLSLIDDLTGLNNRRAFLLIAEQEIKKVDRSKRQNMYLIFADMDNLKWVNDHLGHRVGDEALRDAAEIFRRVFRSMDIIARLGGDEFVVLITEASENTTQKISDRLDQSLTIWNQTAKKPYHLSLSTGIVRYDPTKPCSIENLLVEADQAMYKMKQQKSDEKKQRREEDSNL